MYTQTGRTGLRGRENAEENKASRKLPKELD